MKKRLLTGLVAATMMFSMMSPAFAAEVESEEEEVQQTLETVFDYLNSQEIRLHALETVEYEIPVGDNMVSVSVENAPVAVGYDLHVGEDEYFYIQRGMSYTHTTTIKNFYLNSGTIEMKVYYSCWGNDDPGKVHYRITPSKATISADSPSGCTLFSSTASYDPNYTQTSLIIAYGDVCFKRVLTSTNWNLSMKVTLASHFDDGRLLSRYEYET